MANNQRNSPVHAKINNQIIGPSGMIWSTYSAISTSLIYHYTYILAINLIGHIFLWGTIKDITIDKIEKLQVKDYLNTQNL